MEYLGGAKTMSVDALLTEKNEPYFLWGSMENTVPGYTMIVPPQDRFLILYIRNGAGKLSQGENCWYIENGNLLCLRFGLSFVIHSISGSLSFTSLLLSGACRELPLIVEIQSSSEMETQLKELCSICSRSDYGAAVPQFGPFLAALKSAGFSKQPMKHLHCGHVELLKQILDSRFTENLHLGQFADDFHLSKYKLIKDFKAYYGLPPIEYLISRRIQQACRLLRETDKSVTEIGNEVGMDNTPYFIRTFKKKVGCTPYAFRKSQQNLYTDEKSITIG